LDSQLLAAGRGAVVTCLAKGGPAEADGSVQIGDSVRPAPRQAAAASASREARGVLGQSGGLR
jgi:hypothetical protein